MFRFFDDSYGVCFEEITGETPEFKGTILTLQQIKDVLKSNFEPVTDNLIITYSDRIL